MKALRKRFLVVLTVVMSIISLIGGIIVYNIVPTKIFGWYIGIPIILLRNRTCLWGSTKED